MYNLGRSESTILFVGYQAEGSPGRKLLDGAAEIRLFGEDIPVNARIATIRSMSGHADKKGLLDWINAFTAKPKQVFVVHGDDKVTEIFADCLKEEYGYNAMAPFSGTRYDLANGKFIEITKGIPVEHAETGSRGKVVSDSYTRLKMSSREVSDFIDKCQGLPNKDLDRFSRDLLALIEKYRR
jgi:metallo-beta-lactamase family protein